MKRQIFEITVSGKNHRIGEVNKWCCPVSPYAIAGKLPIDDGDETVISNGTITIVLDYPLNIKYHFLVNNPNGSWSRNNLRNMIYDCYKSVLRDMWGHCIRDLVIERVKVSNHNVKQIPMIKLDIGS